MSAPTVPADHGRGGSLPARREPPPRCAWCKRFVARSTPLTCWRVRVPAQNRQRADDHWNYWARLLCRACAPLTETLWRKNTTERVMIAKRPEGLPFGHPYWLMPLPDSPLMEVAPYLMVGTDPHERSRL